VSARIHVAVGIIYNSYKDKILITKRTSDQHLAGLWEFPGGKVEKNEDVVSALSRELYEELGIVVKRAEKFTTISYDYPDKKVLLDVWKVNEWSGEPLGRENQELIWLKVGDLGSYKFPEANRHIVQSLSLPQIYVISQESYEDVSHLLSVASECFSAGLKIFQLRLKSKRNYKLSKIVKELATLAKEHSAKLILNGAPSEINDYDIDGIHLNSKELMACETRPISEEYILGASCHNKEELMQASRLNVNYAFISPVFATTSYPEKSAIGWEGFYKLNKNINFPVYALGGMTPSCLKKAKTYNAHGVAMIGAVWNSTCSVKKIMFEGI